MKIATIFAASTALLSGCALMAPSLPTKWVNPGITDKDEYAYRLSRDASTCRNVANAYAPGPVSYIPVPDSGSRSYDVSGTVNGQYVTGTLTPRGGGGGFASGFAKGANIGTAMRAGRDRDRQLTAYVECMGQLGWVDGNAPPAVNAPASAQIQ